MSWDGFLPKGIQCKKCGAVLQGQGEGRPAESYFGTYTGLCYACTGAGPYEESYSLVSGARVWNHPPPCPSHRRDRTTFYSFDDCKKCHKGASSEHTYWGSATVQCRDCSARHAAHPLVKKIYFLNDVENVKLSLIHRVADRVWKDRLVAAALGAVAEGGEWTADQKRVAEEVLAEVQPARDNLRNLDPIQWPAGFSPLPAEVKHICRLYGYKIPKEVLLKIFALPRCCPDHPTYHGKRVPQIRRGQFEVCPGCRKVYDEVHA